MTLVGCILRLMRKCFGGVLMTEEILLCLLRIIFSIAWVLTGRQLDGCPVFALSTSFLSWHPCALNGSPSLEVMLSGHYSVIGTYSCLFSDKRKGQVTAEPVTDCFLYTKQELHPVVHLLP